VKVYRGNRDMAPLILYVGTRWTSVFQITPRPPYPRGKDPGTHWIGGWVGHQSRFERFGKKKIRLSIAGLQIPDLPARSIVTVLNAIIGLGVDGQVIYFFLSLEWFYRLFFTGNVKRKYLNSSLKVSQPDCSLEKVLTSKSDRIWS
jgi:hypothetical protein